MKLRNLPSICVLAAGYASSCALAAEATIDPPERSPPRQDLIDSRDIVRNAEAGRLLKELDAERQKRARLQKIYTDAHPDLLLSARKIAELEARLGALGVRTTPPPGAGKSPD